MSAPKSAIKIRSKGRTKKRQAAVDVEYVSNIDAAEYNIFELSRAAMRDVGKYINRLADAAGQNRPGMRRSRRVRGKGSTYRFTVPFAKIGLPHVDIGITHDTWYGVLAEIGGEGQEARHPLRNAVYSHIADIRKIEAQYLSAISKGQEACDKLIDEREMEGTGSGSN